jgi:SAM-dependent methyltransferase
MIDPHDVAVAHDQMAAEYDQLDDLWYSWLFAELHEFIAKRLPPGSTVPRIAVDAGCGTGFQSFLLARAGYAVTGFDLAEELLQVARAKTPAHARLPLEAPPLVDSTLVEPWMERHHRRLASLLEQARQRSEVLAPRFEAGDLRTFDFEALRPEVITCCGSVLSFVDEYQEAICRMALGLAPRGRLFLEVEQKVNPDLVWPLVDAALGGRLGYEQPLKVTLHNLLGAPGRSVRIDYPFELTDGRELTLPIWLFSVRDLHDAFKKAGLRVVARRAVHHATNLLPSIALHEPAPGLVLRQAFGALRVFDHLLAGTWPFWRLGCSVVYCLKRA